MPEDTQHLLGQERGFVPQRERHEHEARERSQLELDQRHEELHRQHEEAHDQHQPGEEQHGDHIGIDEHLREPRELADLLHDRPAGIDAHLGQSARLQQLHLRHPRARGREAQPGEGPEDDARQAVEVADDVGEGAHIEHLLDELGDHLVAPSPAGVAHRPEQARERHVDRDQRGGQERYLAAEQAEARIDVAREDIEETVDDRDIVHGAAASEGAGLDAGGV
jgi:hypothetical protein